MFTRLARRLGWSRNEMRRGSDRIEGWLTAFLVVALLVGGPWTGAWAAHAAYRAHLREQVAEHADRHQVSAVLLERPAPVVADDGGPATGPAVARATWTAPDGSPRSGSLKVAPGLRAGQRIVIWVDGRGAPSRSPREVSPRVDAALAAVLAVLSLTVLLGGTRWAARHQLDRRRLQSWQREWQEVEPRWSRHR